MTPETTAGAARPGIPLGRPLGIPVYLAPSWGFIALLITTSVASDVPSESAAVAWTTALLFTVGIALSVLAHEFGHSVVSLVLGIPIRRITLFLLGGYAEIS